MQTAVQQADSKAQTTIDLFQDVRAGWESLVTTTAPARSAAALLGPSVRVISGKGEGGRRCWTVPRSVTVTCALPALSRGGLSRQELKKAGEAGERLQRSLDRGLEPGVCYTVLGGCLLKSRGTGPPRKVLTLRDPTAISSTSGMPAPRNANGAKWRGPWWSGDKRWNDDLKHEAGWPTGAGGRGQGVFHMAVGDAAEAFECVTVAGCGTC